MAEEARAGEREASEREEREASEREASGREVGTVSHGHRRPIIEPMNCQSRVWVQVLLHSLLLKV
jgi:hypothetical protein